MASHSFHLCPICSRKFTPKYKVASYKGDKITCPRCLKDERAPKQAKSAGTLLSWGREAKVAFHLCNDLGTEQHYIADEKWKGLDATVDKGGRIYINHGNAEHSHIRDKRHFMELIQKQREHLSRR